MQRHKIPIWKMRLKECSTKMGLLMYYMLQKEKKNIYILRAFQTTTQSMKNNLFF